MIERLCIIGVGLIGGSLARALREAGYCRSVVGAGRKPENLRLAVELGVIDSYETDLARAVDIVENSKVQRPSVCNALDTLLVHRAVASEFLPKVAERLAQSEVELRAEEDALNLLQAAEHGAKVVPAEPEDFDQEWLALILVESAAQP